MLFVFQESFAAMKSTSVKGSEEKLNLMTYNLKFMYICAVGPKKELSTVPWKNSLYTLIQIMFLATFLPSFLGLGLALSKFRGDIEIATNILCPGLSLVAAFLPAGYIILNWAQVQKLVDSLETKSLFRNPLVQSRHNLNKILKDTQKKVNLLNRVVAICQFTALSSWIIRPMILNIIHGEEEIEQEVEHWKRLIFIIWLPVDPRTRLNYYLLYFYQIFVTYAFYNFTAPIFSFIFALITYTSAQFTIVAEALKDVDKEKPKMVSELVAFTGDVAEFQEFGTKGGDEKEDVEDLHSETKYRYLKECIRMHQSAIE